MLEKWLRTALEEAGAADVDPSLVGAEAVTALLNLARDAAHGVARPAAPLATFAAGLAIGRAGGPHGSAAGGTLDDLLERVARVAAAADAWDEGPEADAGEDR